MAQFERTRCSWAEKNMSQYQRVVAIKNKKNTHLAVFYCDKTQTKNHHMFHPHY